MNAISKFNTKSRPARAGLIMAVLTVFSILSTLYGWFKSMDVRAWWPVGLLFQFLVTYVYAIAYVLLVNNHRLVRPSFLILYHTALGSVLLLKTYLYYVIAIDWTDINSGFGQLSVVQEIVTSHKTFYAIHLLFLSVAVICSYAARRAVGSARS